MDQATEGVALTKMEDMIHITRLRLMKTATALSPKREQRMRGLIRSSNALNLKSIRSGYDLLLYFFYFTF
jgi:hypothetical protein